MNQSEVSPEALSQKAQSPIACIRCGSWFEADSNLEVCANCCPLRLHGAFQIKHSDFEIEQFFVLCDAIALSKSTYNTFAKEIWQSKYWLHFLLTTLILSAIATLVILIESANGLLPMDFARIPLLQFGGSMLYTPVLQVQSLVATVFSNQFPESRIQSATGQQGQVWASQPFSILKTNLIRSVIVFLLQCFILFMLHLTFGSLLANQKFLLLLFIFFSLWLFCQNAISQLLMVSIDKIDPNAGFTERELSRLIFPVGWHEIRRGLMQTWHKVSIVKDFELGPRDKIFFSIFRDFCKTTVVMTAICWQRDSLKKNNATTENAAPPVLANVAQPNQ